MTEQYKTGDKCPKSGRWLQVETKEVSWHEEGDKFPGYYKKVDEAINGAPLYDVSVSRRAYYELVE